MTERFKKTLALDGDGDLDDDARSLYYLDGPPGVEQELRVRLGTAEGEDPFKPEFGLPVFVIAGAPPEVVEREVRDELLSDDRVESVPTVDVNLDVETRIAEVSIVAELVDGEPVEITTMLPSKRGND